MVKLSPKALRFAEAATTSVVEGRLFEGGRVDAWRDWARAEGGGPSRGSASFIEVPEQVGILFMLAIGHVIETASPDGQDRDGEAGNDLEFLRSVHASLEHDLGGPLRPEPGWVRRYG